MTKLYRSELNLDASAVKFGLSARGYYRTLRVARIIADLEESKKINAVHSAEAVQYLP